MIPSMVVETVVDPGDTSPDSAFGVGLSDYDDGYTPNVMR